MFDYIKAKNFISRNARPLDYARWNYLFEDGSQEAVIKALQTYQNEDGGFAYGLEPDCWNEHSTPMQTWAATRIINEIQLKDKKHPMIQSILQYLSSNDDFDGFIYNGLNTVKTNNDYPHASWWSYKETQELSYNPTASLIGFILKYADKESELYQSACDQMQDAYKYFKENYPFDSMHEVACFVELYDYIKECSLEQFLNMKEFHKLLQKQIKHLINYNTDEWYDDYVCKPSLFIKSKKSDFYLENIRICHKEYEFIRNHQNEDGTWNVNWDWSEYSEQWYVSKNWWKSEIIIQNMKFLKEFGKEDVFE